MINIVPYESKKNNNLKLFHLFNNNKLLFLPQGSAPSMKHHWALQIKNVSLPFNMQLYNNSLYITAEMLSTDEYYNENIALIHEFEKRVLLLVDNNADINMISTIKEQSQQIHIKTMIKKNKNKQIINTIGLQYLETIDLNNLKKLHALNNKYNIIITPEILWINNEKNNCGINYFLHTIQQIK